MGKYDVFFEIINDELKRTGSELELIDITNKESRFISLIIKNINGITKNLEITFSRFLVDIINSFEYAVNDLLIATLSIERSYYKHQFKQQNNKGLQI